MTSARAGPSQKFRLQKPKLLLAPPPVRAALFSYTVSGALYDQKLATQRRQLPQRAAKPKTALSPEPVREPAVPHK